MSTEAQKRASKKYYLAHKEYYREKTKESIKKIRQERKEYKQRIDDAIEKIKREYYINQHEWNDRIVNEALDILEGKLWKLRKH